MVTQLKPVDVETSSSPVSIPDVTIVLVCWNNKDYLEPCLESLYEGGLQSSFDVVVVDNGSSDGSQQMLREKFPMVKIIQNDNNVGLARACNQGAEATDGRYVLLLNNDTLVSGPSLQAMVDFMDRTADAGAAGGKLLNPDGSFQAGYANFSSLKEEFLVATRIGEHFWQGYPLHLDTDQVKPVGWLSSACLLLRRTALAEVGLLEESFFIYGDEVDLQYRLQQADWKVYYLAYATTIHYGGRSMDRWRRRKMVYRGKLLFYQRNYGLFRSTLLRAMFTFTSVLKILFWTFSYLLSDQQDRSRQEIKSNLEIIQMCFNHDTAPPS